ncbi:isopentenyl phosphate kinase [[Eubacterium] cellulosolvens]
MELIILKLGGSIITEKSGAPSFKHRLFDKIAKELSNLEVNMLLVHGAGSYGHPIAKKYSIHKGYTNKKQLKGVTETKRSMFSLTLKIVDSLIKHNVPAVPFLSSSCMVAKSGRLMEVDLLPFKILLDIGLVPLCSGDVIADQKTGFTIVSGDQIAVYLAKKLGADRVIFGCDVDGIFDSDPKKNPTAKLLEKLTLDDLRDMTFRGESLSTDVTGGMSGKIKESLDFVSSGGEVIIMNLNEPRNLTKLLNGEEVQCTRLIPK